MIFGLKAKLAVGAIAVTAAFGAGWTGKGWFEDSKDLAAERAQQILADMTRKEMGKIASNVENKLSNLRGSERVIDRGIIREVQKPVFRNVCIPDDSDTFRVLNQIANGETPSEFAGESTEQAAGAD